MTKTTTVKIANVLVRAEVPASLFPDSRDYTEDADRKSLLKLVLKQS